MKWNNLYGDYKAIRDYVMSSGGTSYYNMTKNERIATKLIMKFNKDLYDCLESFCLQRPCMVPPSSFDSGLTTPSPTMAPRPTIVSHSATTTTDEENEYQEPADAHGLPNVQTPEVPLSAPGDNVRGSTGRTNRRRSADFSGILKSSHDNLIRSLDKHFELEG